MTKKESLEAIEKLLVDHGYLYSTNAPHPEAELLRWALKALEHHYALLDKSYQIIGHTINVYLSQSARGAYPLEIQPGTQQYLGLPGFTAHQQILKQLELTRKKTNEQRDPVQS